MAKVDTSVEICYKPILSIIAMFHIRSNYRSKKLLNILKINQLVFFEVLLLHHYYIYASEQH